jgi:hypothetical protein
MADAYQLLKKVFDEVGERSRSELTGRLFFGHYEPQLVKSAPLGADGWFIDPRARRPGRRAIVWPRPGGQLPRP